MFSWYIYKNKLKMKINLICCGNFNNSYKNGKNNISFAISQKRSENETKH